MINGNIVDFFDGKRGVVVVGKVIIFKGNKVDGYCIVSDFTGLNKERVIKRILSSKFNDNNFNMKALYGVRNRLISPSVLWKRD